jgi:predicted  nucleic acid-binding Zn-ribbon protein
MAGEPITDKEELLEKGGEAGLIPGPVTEKIHYNGWSYDQEDPGYGYRNITKIVPYPNYNGGACWVGEQATQSDVDRIAGNSALVFNYIATGLNLAKFATGQFAKLDFAKDIKSAKQKLDTASASASAKINSLDKIGEGITGLAEQIDDLRSELKDLGQELSSLASDIKNWQSAIQSLDGVLSTARQNLASAEAKLASVQASRGSYPAGTTGTRAWADAVKNAQAGVRSANQTVNTAEKNVAKAKDDANAVITEYNDVSAVAIPKAQDLVSGVNELGVREQNYANALESINSSMQQRSEAIKDMGKAQEILSQKLRVSFNLGQMAIGASGLSEGFKYVQAEQYYRAGAEGANTAWSVITPYANVPGLSAYAPLIRKAIVSAGKIAQSGGNFEAWVLDFGQATLAIQSMEKMGEALREASELNENGREYEAWSKIADQTALGCEIIGTIGETASQFFPTPIPVGPAIKPASKFVGGVSSGSLQTLVTSGKLAEEGRYISAEIGTGKLAGVTFDLFASPVVLWNSIAQVFGMGEPPAEVLRRMAMTGVQNLAPPDMKFSVGLRPTMPSAPNPVGTSFPPVYVNESGQ